MEETALQSKYIYIAWLRLPSLALPRSGSQGMISAFRHPYAELSDKKKIKKIARYVKGARY